MANAEFSGSLQLPDDGTEIGCKNPFVREVNNFFCCRPEVVFFQDYDLGEVIEPLGGQFEFCNERRSVRISLCAANEIIGPLRSRSDKVVIPRGQVAYNLCQILFCSITEDVPVQLMRSPDRYTCRFRGSTPEPGQHFRSLLGTQAYDPNEY